MLGRLFIASVIAFMPLSACAQTQAMKPVTSSELPMAGKNLVVFVKTGEIRQAGMGMHLARAAAKKGGEVTVIFGADGVTYPQTKGSQPIFEATGETPRQMISGIIAAGGKVQVCKLCTIWLNLEQTDFLPQVEIVTGEDIFRTLYQDNVRSLEF